MAFLTRTGPAKNLHRFYVVRLAPTLFGDWTLLREWADAVHPAPCASPALTATMKRRRPSSRPSNAACNTATPSARHELQRAAKDQKATAARERVTGAPGRERAFARPPRRPPRSYPPDGTPSNGRAGGSGDFTASGPGRRFASDRLPRRSLRRSSAKTPAPSALICSGPPKPTLPRQFLRASGRSPDPGDPRRRGS
jgi:hypothetical protein